MTEDDGQKFHDEYPVEPVKSGGSSIRHRVCYKTFLLPDRYRIV